MISDEDLQSRLQPRTCLRGWGAGCVGSCKVCCWADVQIRLDSLPPFPVETTHTKSFLLSRSKFIPCRAPVGQRLHEYTARSLHAASGSVAKKPFGKKELVHLRHLSGLLALGAALNRSSPSSVLCVRMICLRGGETESLYLARLLAQQN